MKAFLIVWLIINGFRAVVDAACLMMGRYPLKRWRNDTAFSLFFSVAFVAWGAALLLRGY